MPLPPFRERARFVSPWIALIATGLLASCSPEVTAEGGELAATSTEVDPTAVQKREAPQVRVAEVRREDVERVLETNAPVESVSEIDVVAEATGRVLEVHVQEGSRVTAGQVLAKLDDRDQQIAVSDAGVSLAEAEAALLAAAIAEREAAGQKRTAKLDLDQAQRDLDRNLELAKGEKVNPLSVQTVETSRLARDNAAEALTQAELAEQKAKVETKRLESAKRRAELVLERAQRDLERTTLLAPIDGVVAQRSIEPGRNLNVGEVAFGLTDLEDLRVIIFRPQRELDLFAGNADLALTATSEARPDFIFQGTIERTSPVIDRTSGSFRVTAHLDPASRPNEAGKRARLLPGMLLRLYIVTGVHKDTLVVPKRAVRREGSAVFVLAVRGDKLTRVPVEESYTTDDDVEVLLTDATRTLEAGDRVVVVGSRELGDGDAVKVAGEEGAATESAPKATTEPASTSSEDHDA